MPPIITKLLLFRILISVSLNALITHAAVLSVGTYNAADTFGGNTDPQRVEFGTTFSVVPLVFALATSDGGNSAIIRIFDADQTGFSSLIVEPAGWDGQHIQMTTVSYIAIIPGEVVLPNGTTFSAGFLDTNATQGGSTFTSGESYDNIDFATTYSKSPTLITGLQSRNNEPTLDASTNPDPYLGVAINGLDENGFDLALERLETGTGNSSAGIIPERVGWLAVEQGTGSFSLDGETVAYDFANSINAADGWDDGGEFINFTQNFSTTPVGVASMTSRNGGDGGTIRRGSLNANGVTILIEEDTTNDSERNHTQEDISTLYFSSEFIYIPEPSTTLSSVISLCILPFLRRR